MPWLIQKISGEGTSTPFVARVHLGLVELRDHALADEVERRAFDEDLIPLVENLAAVRKAAHRIASTIKTHAERVRVGAAVVHRGPAVEVDESIDRDLTDALGKLYERGYAASKSLQAVTRRLGLSIGWLFQKEAAFREGIESYRQRGQEALADYLAAVRAWSQEFLARRAAFTHSGEGTVASEYRLGTNHTIEFVPPGVDGMPLDQYALRTANRIIRLAEDLVAHAVASRLKSPMILCEIPREVRDPSIVRRFKLGIEGAESEPWRITYEEDDSLV